MAKFVSRCNPTSTRALKRKPHGTVVRHHFGREDVKFTRIPGGWLREREDVTERPEVVTSAAVAAECNRSIGCKESWAKVY